MKLMWYLGLVALGLDLAVILYSVVKKNYLGAIVLLLLGASLLIINLDTFHPRKWIKK